MIILDYKDRTPIYEQLEERLTEMIHLGAFLPGEQLPSVRSLAMELSINPNTIQRTYGELERKGIIYCVKGKGNYVAEQKELTQIRSQKMQEELQQLVEKAVQYGWTEEELKQGMEEAWKIYRQKEKGGREND